MTSLARVSPIEVYAAADAFYVGDLGRALELAEASLKRTPTPEAFGIAAAVYSQRSEVRKAIATYREGLARFENDIALLVNFARCLRETPGRSKEAVTVLNAVVSRAPGFAPARLSLIETLRTSTIQLSDAADLARGYVADFPEDANGHLALALTLFNLGRLKAAGACADICITLGGNLPRAWELKANIAVLLGDAAEALQCYRNILALQPSAAMHSHLLSAMQYCDTTSEVDITTAAKAWAQAYAPALAMTAWPQIAFDPGRPLSIGILSRDFRLCSSLFLARPLLENLPVAWRITFYANLEVQDDTSTLFRSFCDRWVDISAMDDDAAAARIADDKIDVLIDINGHTLGGRPGVFARKPTPVQVAWLDYVGTTGLAAMDAIIADAGHVPLSDQALYVEPIRHVAHNLYRYAPPADAPNVAALPAVTQGHITFGCFNAPYKITPTTVAIWGRVLRALPTARLLLNESAYRHEDTRARFQALLQKEGVHAERLIFRFGAPDPVGMMGAYADIDIALDPCPYSGGLTTLEALYMGVPVVTMPGKRFGARHSAVHLGCVGLHDWIASDPDTYEAVAVAKALDLAGLATLRAGLRPRVQGSPLMDGHGFAKEFTGIIRDLWKAACARVADR